MFAVVRPIMGWFSLQHRILGLPPPATPLRATLDPAPTPADTVTSLTPVVVASMVPPSSISRPGKQKPLSA